MEGMRPGFAAGADGRHCLDQSAQNSWLYCYSWDRHLSVIQSVRARIDHTSRSSELITDGGLEDSGQRSGYRRRPLEATDVSARRTVTDT